MVTFAQRLVIAVPATVAGIFALLAAFLVIPGTTGRHDGATPSTGLMGPGPKPTMAIARC